MALTGAEQFAAALDHSFGCKSKSGWNEISIDFADKPFVWQAIWDSQIESREKTMVRVTNVDRGTKTRNELDQILGLILLFTDSKIFPLVVILIWW